MFKSSELSRVFSKSCNLIWLICVQVFSGKLNSNKPNFQLSLNFLVTSGRREFPRGFPSKMEHFSDWHPLSCIPILCLCLCLCTFVYPSFLLCPEMEHFSDWHPLSCIPILCLCLCAFLLSFFPFLLCPKMEHFSDWHLVSCSPIPFKLFLSLPTPPSQFPHFKEQVGYGHSSCLESLHCIEGGEPWLTKPCTCNG